MTYAREGTIKGANAERQKYLEGPEIPMTMETHPVDEPSSM